MAAPTLTRLLTSVVMFGTVAACSAGPRPASSIAPVAFPSTVRAVRSDGSAISIADIAAQAARTDFVFFGEQHDDPETHFAELALLEAIGRVKSNVIVSLEMFERDVQPLVDDYMSGRISETDFLAKSRPWPNYTTDYRPLVMLARARGWKVVAANVPRPIASAVSRKGLEALDTLPRESRAQVATDIKCTHDAYYTLFADQMKEHGGPGTASDAAATLAMTDRYFEAQCIKDETMAEAIVAARKSSSDAIVVHFNGAFHSDQSLGTVSRVLRRSPQSSHIVISAMPVADPAVRPSPDSLSSAQFIVLTRRAPAK